MDEPGPSQDASGLVDHFFRHQYGSLVARLCRKYGANQLENIEDAVQLALERALGTWVRRGVPEQPQAWLARVAENSLIDGLRRQKKMVEPEADGTSRGRERSTNTNDEAGVVFAAEIADAELRMLFVCCDPSLSARAQLVLCLKLLGGFSIREIAARLFIAEANAQKIFERARQHMRSQAESTADLMNASADALAERVPSVQHAIYLQFTEGHFSDEPNQPIRQDVCLEALRLAELLAAQPIGNRPSSWALLSLLHFQFARLPARIDSAGELVLLEEQDRSKWDRLHIQAGFRCLHCSGQGGDFSRYHGEATILAEHCLAPSYAETNWGEIVALYEALERLAPSPLYTLNRAIALAEAQGPGPALALLKELSLPSWLSGYYLWDATMGELNRRAGNTARARIHLQRAVEAAPNRAQRQLFERRLARLAD